MPSIRHATLRVVTAMTVALTLAVSGCSGRGDNSPADRSGVPTVVASTDVWGSVAQLIAGGDARVTSIISNGAADPHSFEPSPSDAAALTDASIVVFNGGGYDRWVQSVLDERGDANAVDAYSLLDAAAVGEPQPANEHVFYELRTASAVAGELAAKLAAADPGKTDEYRSRADDFTRRAETIRGAENALRSQAPGAAVIATEPVAHYLVRAAGLTDKTPAGFIAAIEHDTDPAPADLAAALDLITSRQVAALIVNEQTMTATTRRLRDAARDAGVPIVPVTETLPAGTDYLTWQNDTVTRLGEALRQGTRR